MRTPASNSRPINAGHPSRENVHETETLDPIVQILLRGDVPTVSEAEQEYLDANLRQVIELVESSISDEEFRAHPLIALLLSHGSRDWEDSLS
jgi:hypothetical protein